MGTSADRIFLPRGTHTIQAVLPGFQEASAVHEIQGRVFGSLFFPLLKKIEFTLKAEDPAETFALYAADYADWSFGGEPTSAWQVPLSLSEGAYRAGANNQDTREILLAASRFAVTRAALRDLVRAKILLDNGGLSPSPAGIIGSISDILRFLSQNPGSAEWLSGLLPPESAALLGASDWLKNEYPAFTIHTLPAPETAAAFPTQLNLAGLTFRIIPATDTTNNFMICETPVPRLLFETFLNENPEWEEHKTDYYPDEISIYPPEAYDMDIITGVTWFAAEAFCRWLTGRLPASMAEMEIRLPTEAEWEHAAVSIGGMENSGWEWCADPFAPLSFISASPEAIKAVGSPERSLRGRSSASGQTRASLPPELSSPFVTFRPVIAQKDGEK